MIYLTSQSAAISLLKSARLLRQSDVQDIASNVFINPDLSPAESKLAFKRRQRIERKRERRLWWCATKQFSGWHSNSA